MLGVHSPSSNIHFLLTGPRAEGRSVMGLRLRLEVHVRLVGLELGLGVNDKFVGTGICMEGE